MMLLTIPNAQVPAVLVALSMLPVLRSLQEELQAKWDSEGKVPAQELAPVTVIEASEGSSVIVQHYFYGPEADALLAALLAIRKGEFELLYDEPPMVARKGKR